MFIITYRSLFRQVQQAYNQVVVKYSISAAAADQEERYRDKKSTEKWAREGRFLEEAQIALRAYQQSRLVGLLRLKLPFIRAGCG